MQKQEEPVKLVCTCEEKRLGSGYFAVDGNFPLESILP